MFKTYVGPVESADNVAYLRPETAQAIFAQFKNVLDVSRQKVPFGICQIGKAFRNEVTPRNFTFRSREFEQMELEFFIKPDEAVEAMRQRRGRRPARAIPASRSPTGAGSCGTSTGSRSACASTKASACLATSLEDYWQKPEELAHYARATVDILFKFPFGTEELEGIAARSDFDLSQHQKLLRQADGVFRRGTAHGLGQARRRPKRSVAAALRRQHAPGAAQERASTPPKQPPRPKQTRADFASGWPRATTSRTSSSPPPASIAWSSR